MPDQSPQEKAIRTALESVMDPELNLSVIDLGLIREVRYEPGLVYISLLLTTPFCPYAPQLIEEIKAAVNGVVSALCQVDILPEAWNSSMMPDPGLLGYM